MYAQADLVKICGLRRPEHALAAVDAGADLIGFVFAPSKRRVTEKEARTAIDAVRASYPNAPIRAVGVFLDEPVEMINHIAESARLDLVQLHRSPNESEQARLRVPYILATRTIPGVNAGSMLNELTNARDGNHSASYFLVDGYHPDHLGGSGSSADWEVVAEMAKHVPVILAGGLKPGNVGIAIAQVRPIGVDVSSGVEANGAKNEKLIVRFVSSAKHAFAAVS